MTPAALVKARDGASDATAAAVALWKSIVGDPDADPVIPEVVPAREAGAALAVVAKYTGESTDVDDSALREGVIRLGGFIAHTVPGVRQDGDTGFHAADNAMIRSGAGSILTAWRIRRGSVCG